MKKYFDFSRDCFNKMFFWTILFFGAVMVMQGCCCKSLQSEVKEKRQLPEIIAMASKSDIKSDGRMDKVNNQPLIADTNDLTSNEMVLLPALSNMNLADLHEESTATMQLVSEVIDPGRISALSSGDRAYFADLGSVKIKSEHSFLRKDKRANRFMQKKLPLGLRSISTVITAGPNISFKSSKEDYGTTNHKHIPGVGFQVGVGSMMEFNDKWSVCPALLVKQNNASEELSYSSGTGGDPGETFKSKYSYTYLSAPILAEYKVSQQLSIVAGPELNYLLSSSVKPDGEEKESLTDNSVKAGVGAQLGVKYAIPSSSGSSAWMIQLIYDHRISRLNSKEMDYGGGTGYEMPAWNMKSIQLGVTCSICNLHKK